MPSRDFGMVGFVKRLVDHTVSGTLGFHQPDWVADPRPIEWMRVQDGLVTPKRPARRPEEETGTQPAR